MCVGGSRPPVGRARHRPLLTGSSHWTERSPSVLWVADACRRPPTALGPHGSQQTRAGSGDTKEGAVASATLRGSRFFGGLIRPGIDTFGVDVAVDELDDRDRGAISVTEPRLEHPGIAPCASLIAGPQHVKKLLDHR